MGDNSADVAFIISSSSPILSLATVKLQGINANSYEEYTATQMPVQFTATGGWGSYVYQYDIKITNKTGKKLSAWSIEVPLPLGTAMVSGWNADFQMNNQTLIISNLSYNGSINKNGSTTIGMQLSTNINNYMPIVSKRFGR
jgi:cellulase/cellobiase CelA1